MDRGLPSLTSSSPAENRMNLLISSLALGALAATSGGPEATTDTEVELRTKVYRNWKFRLPAESWKKVGKAVHLPAFGADVRFRAQLDGTSLALDTDADGEFDTKIEKQGGVVLLVKGQQRVAIRLRSTPDWSFAPASVKAGKIEGTKVCFIDQNNNGRFNDFGADAMVVGIGKTASFLSEVISVKGKLFALKINDDGSKVTYAPYSGATSTIDFKVLTKGKVLAAVLRSTDGKFSFDVARAKHSLTVPTATYTVHSGLLSFGGNKVSVRTGASKPIALKIGENTEVRFGGPIRVEFDFKVAGGKYHFSPEAIWYFGRGGEEYYNWQPLGKSPKIAIVDRKTEESVAEVVFPPSC